MRMPLAIPSLIAVVLSWSPLSAQDRPLVVIDPGHGGDEVGVVAGDVLEKDLILEVSMSIAAEFVRAGYDVAFTRTSDVAVEWADRRGLADESGAVALFMLHAMRSDDPADAGAEVYFDEDTAASVALAAAVGAEFRALGSEVLLDPRPWPFLKSPTVPTAMIEVAHLTNPDEGARMADPAFHHEMGRALVAAVEAVAGG
ncbi:MAG: N-acetylmuramoyl-L-alanine amidase [Gemmatimonadetes bacterium]|nr:N-acetylmuramoyl-L-alanine amidase [Gemmatimonadota bacterium]NNK63427.1 N-acetylmuramoyl-L-alanine amidase [Gemmatimonadota bacterium]